MSVVSLADARDAPEISESDALTKFNGEPAFLSKDGIARYEAAENRFVPIGAFQSLFRDYIPGRAIVSLGKRPAPLGRLDPSQYAGRHCSQNENRANQFGRRIFVPARGDY